MIHLVVPTLILSTIALVTSLIAIVLVLAQRWSTHRIEWKPLQIEDTVKEAEKELEEQDQEDEEFLEKALHLQRNKKKKEDKDPLDEILETNNF